jgi:PAS domain S-box-containing protein
MDTMMGQVGIGVGLFAMMATITVGLMRFVTTRDKRLDERIKALEIARDECLQREVETAKELGELRAICARVEHGAIMANVVCGEDGLIVEWNAGATTLFGYSKEEVIGQPISILIPMQLRGRHEHGFSKAVAEKRGPAADAAARLRDSYGLRKDGSEFPVTITLGDGCGARDYV